MSLADIVILTTYRFVIYPLGLALASLWALSGNKKMKAFFKMRTPQGSYHPLFDLPKKQNPIWIHCSSGEFEYAKPIITEYKKKFPQQKILVTYFSPTYQKNVSLFPGVDMHCPLPWDFPGAVASFIKHHQPKALLISRTDLWPELLFQAHRLKVPSLLFSATKGNIKPWQQFFSPLYKWLYRKIDVIFAVEQEDKNNFLSLGADLVLAKGDTRYDQVVERVNQDNPHLKTQLFKLIKEPILVCGSTWEEDEEVLVPALSELAQSHQLKIVLAPHEPTKEHIAKLEGLLSNYNLSNQKYSESLQWDSSTLIIDQVGLLADIYNYGDYAFIGGSFKKTVHSVMEPLASGCPSFVGPLHLNNRESIKFSKYELFEDHSMVCIFKNSEQLIQSLGRIIEQKNIENFKEAIKTKVYQHTGGTKEVLSWLEQRT